MLLSGRGFFSISALRRVYMKKERFFLVGMLAIALVFGLTVSGCGGDGDGDSVDKNLPAISDLPDFSGAFVSSQTEAIEMVAEAISALGSISPGLDSSLSIMGKSEDVGGRSAVRNMSREAYNESFNNQSLGNGITATGSIKGYENDSELSMLLKLVLNFNNTQSSGYTLNGRYYLDDDFYFKEQGTKITMRINADNGYAFSVSKGGKGLKFNLKMKVKANVTIDGLSASTSTPSYTYSIEVYDNTNTKKFTYNDPAYASRFFNNPLPY